MHSPFSTLPEDYSGGMALAEAMQARLDWIERVLKFDPNHPDRKELVREYLDLTDPATEPDL